MRQYVAYAKWITLTNRRRNIKLYQTQLAGGAYSAHCWIGGERWTCLQFHFLGYATVVNLNCTKSFFFYLKCSKIASGWGSAPDPTGGAYSAPPDPLAVRVRREGRGRHDREEQRRAGQRMAGEEICDFPLYLNFLATPLAVYGDVSKPSRNNAFFQNTPQ